MNQSFLSSYSCLPGGAGAVRLSLTYYVLARLIFSRCAALAVCTGTVNELDFTLSGFSFTILPTGLRDHRFFVINVDLPPSVYHFKCNSIIGVYHSRVSFKVHTLNHKVSSVFRLLLTTVCRQSRAPVKRQMNWLS